MSRRRSQGSETSSRAPGPSRGKGLPKEAFLHTTPTPGAVVPLTSRDTMVLLNPPNSRTAAVKCGHATVQHPVQARRRRHPSQALTSADLADPLTPWVVSSWSESSCSSIPPARPACPALLSSPPPRGQPEHVRGGGGLRFPANTLPPRDADRFLAGCRKLHPWQFPTRASRLPPLQPITNLSFSRSFTFSFFQLPLHQSARSRADRMRDLTLLLRQGRH